jgi:Cysteine-rich CPXCG
VNEFPSEEDSADQGATMKDEASYNCDSCGEEIVVPIDVSAGSSQEYVEDCPVCCPPHIIHVEVDEAGDVRVWAERE